jgi:cobalt transporter subunit CbtA
MFRRMCLAAVAAGLLAGVLISVVQHFTTTPLILRAEEVERAGFPGTGWGASVDGGVGSAASERHAGGGHDHGFTADSALEPSGALERALFTALADVLVGIGFAFVVVAAFAWKGGEKVRAWTGIFWGAAGFAVFTLAPALGLPPELPGSFAADLAARQLWWASAAGSAAVGLGLLAFGRNAALKVLGLVVAVIPHVVGAPRPESVGGGVAPELASQFAASSIVVNAMFWVLLGWLSAVFYGRFDEAA